MHAMPTNPAPAPRPPAAPRGAAPPPRRVPWGWLEWVLLGQLLIPGLLLIPGMSVVRLVTRIAVFALPLAAWAMLYGARPRPWRRPFPAAPALAFGCGWMLLSLAHPTTNALLSGLAQVALYAAVFSPAFWGPSAVADESQVRRLLAIVLLGNAMSALVGIGQFYRPGLFNPPVVAFSGPQEYLAGLSYTTADGRSVMRPCGLGDMPGGASNAGVWAAVVGLAWALRPMAAWRRLACVGLAMAGTAVIYFTMVRSALMLVAVGGLSLLGFLVLQRDLRRATILAVAGGAVLAGSLAWAGRDGGQEIISRFASLLEDDLSSTYYKNRGHFLTETLHDAFTRFPLGAGLGRWGMMYDYFGNHSFDFGRGRGPLWAEIQWTAWMYDGGLPLMLVNAVALAAALINTARIGLTSPDRELRFWGAVTWAATLPVAIQTVGSMPFVTGAGVQFWLLSAALHAADGRARWRRRQAHAQAARAAAARRAAAYGPPGPAPAPRPVPGYPG